MSGEIILTLIILLAAVLIGAAFIFFAGDLFYPPASSSVAPSPFLKVRQMEVVEKITTMGTLKQCVVEDKETQIRFIVQNHICIEEIGAVMNVTKAYGQYVEYVSPQLP